MYNFLMAVEGEIYASETQLWALEKVPKSFQCDDEPIQARNKGYT